ncbi:MAG: ATP-dependent DNA helicase RecQ [Halieaceae bacterium]
MAYRTGQRFGVNHLIDVLRGADTEKIRQFDHQVLPTYGIGSDIDNKQWRSVFRQLVARGYLTVDLERYGALTLCEKCRPILRGEETIALRLDTLEKSGAGKSKKSGQARSEASDPVLWDLLREHRKQLADEQGVPPFVIFHDRTLLEMVADRPTNRSEFTQLNGVGATKLEKYADSFLAVLAEYGESHN